MFKNDRAITIYIAPTIAGVVIVLLAVMQALGVAHPVTQGVGFVLALGALMYAFSDMLVRDIRHSYVHSIGKRTVILGVMVVETVALFATTYLAVSDTPDQFVGLHTVLDAFYFTMTTLMTIGFGDVAAQGQLARGVVLVQMLFTILVLSSSVRLFSSLVRNLTKDVGEDRSPHRP